MYSGLRPHERAPYVVVVALLLTQSSDQALDWTIHHAVDDPCWILHFVQIAPPEWTSARALRALAGGSDADECAERVSTLSGTPLEGRLHFRRLVDGRPARALVRYASEVDADLLVVEAPSRPTWMATLVGSVADRVARDVGCSVAVIRSKAHLHRDLVN